MVLECRLRHFDGAYRSIAGCALPIHETDGRFAGYVGSCSEVSAGRGCGTAVSAGGRDNVTAVVVDHVARTDPDEDVHTTPPRRRG